MSAPDDRAGWYYVTCSDGPRWALLAGPFRRHEDALAWVERVREVAERLDLWSWFYAFGTARMDQPGPAGKLNELSGVPAELLREVQR